MTQTTPGSIYDIGMVKRFVRRYKKSESEIAYWIVKCLDDMKYKPMPTPPGSMQKFYAMDEVEKRKINKNPSFWFRSDVMQYLDKKYAVKMHNASNLYWIAWAIDKIDIGDVMTRDKLINAKNQLESLINYA